MGRLIGAVLSLIGDWKWQSDAEMTTLFTGSYHVPFTVIHYIEIIAVYCSVFRCSKKTCVIDRFRNRLSI